LIIGPSGTRRGRRRTAAKSRRTDAVAARLGKAKVTRQEVGGTDVLMAGTARSSVANFSREARNRFCKQMGASRDGVAKKRRY